MATGFEYPSPLLIHLVFGCDVHRYENAHYCVDLDSADETQGDERYADPEPETLRAVLRQKRLKEIDDHF